MCGIIVVIGNNAEEKVQTYIKKLTHRGSDSSKIVTYNNISIGFTRLSINDTSSKADQPFEYSDYIGVFNAEIYNHSYLKDKYQLSCYSCSDTEVVLPLYDKFKENILPLLDGFYSSVIYDKKKQELIVLRDYIGKKPLFFAYDGENQYICSELKVLSKIKYFELLPKGISKIDGNKIVQVQEHYEKYLNKPSDKKMKEIIEQAIFKRVVDIKDDKIGVFLSGGLDSSIVATLLEKFFPNSDIQYYSLLDLNHPDYKYVKIMQKYLKLGDNSFSMINLPDEEEFLSILKKVIYHTESFNPSIVSNGICSYLLSKKAHENGIKVVLTGDGADEMFMGYYDQETLVNKDQYKVIHQNLLDDLSLTELRRVDLSCMANSIEVRCPFLDKNIYDVIHSFEYKDFFGDCEGSLNKNILRRIFKNDLPKEISEREKVSLDVGSGIQKMMVDLAKEKSMSEKSYLKSIWNEFFQNSLSEVAREEYFYAYPAFDDDIPMRGEKYKNKSNYVGD